VAAGASELAAGVRDVSPREELLEELRPVSFAVAYRMLGSVSEAEDIVQEALLRLHRALEDGERIQSPRAFVATVTTRLAIDELRSARARRERYVGEWLPEPLITNSSDDPAQQAEMADSLSLAMLVLLESLSSEQRAVLLLDDVFDYDHAQIAERSSARARTTSVSSRRERGATLSSDARASKPPMSISRSSRGASSPPPRTATSPGSRRCWPTTLS
jgi:RNA polymerase sigma factor (sigma-70 family)